MRPEPGRRAHRRLWLWVASGGAVLLVVSAVFAAQPWTGKGDHSLADRLAALGLVVAVLSLGVSTLGLRRPVERDTANLSRGWAANLASQVKKAEGDQRRQLLGADTQRINLTFTLRAAPARAADAPDAGRLFDGTPTVPDVADYYRRTRPRRLVVTGAAGSGKTVLALELMLALLDGRGEDDPVPVRLSLASWDTSVPLPDLLVHRLVEAYDWPAAMATELVRHRRVLPVLDGLDEMDPTLPDGTPAPDAPRALAALRALNAYQDGLDAGPLVLTCRTAHYDALAARARLTDAARIEIDAVPPADAHTYLSQRAIDRDRWQTVLNTLRDDPTGPLATALSTPWRLCLAATVHAHDHDPADLLQHTTPHDLEQYLLARYIPASLNLHPHRRHHPDDTHRWLARLARHLATPAPSDGSTAHGTGARTDLTLHRLWPMAGTNLVRWTDATLTTLTVLSPIVYVAEQSVAQGWRVVSLCVYGAVAALTAFLTLRSRPDRPAGTDLAALRTPAGRRHVYRALLTDLPAGAACGAVIWVLNQVFNYHLRSDLENFSLFGDEESRRQLAMWAFLCISGGAALGLIRGIAAALRVPPAAAVAPRRIIRGELVVGAALAVVAALSVMIWMTLTVFFIRYDDPRDIEITHIDHPPYTSEVIVDYTIVDYIADGLPTLLVFGSMAGLLAGLTRSGARRYLVFILCSRRRLPWRLGVFLDHCCDTGLMRLSGSSYQFRHRELQHWLAAHPHPVTHSTAPDDSGHLLAPPRPPLPPTVHLTADS
ncbi:NACHT domain-containing protein [Streptomyces sp. CBMA156]|uniref:NACHT domain-containing protein n=1 Tax=Streptomyces sp. CBMA156 TaxID=1930280 RepID=UPI001661CA15|nr:NACHT domain-containing protein [Streptomyces sp. CBMA156]